MSEMVAELDAFAAEREPILREAAGELRGPVEAAIASGDWQEVVDTLADIFSDAYEAQSGYASPGFTQAVTLIDALERTVPAENREAQVERIAAWLSTAVIGAAMDAAADRMPGMATQWVTMEDERVRPIHAVAHGQTRRGGQAFDIGGFALQYPGQPVGPPEVWINCRCTLRVVRTADALVAATDPPTTAIIAAVPTEGDPVWKVSGDGDPHVTLAFFGESEGLDADPIGGVLAALAAAADPVTESVMGRGTLGEDKADVALIEAKGLAPLREALVSDPAVAAALARVEQFPAWIPHLTLGYPDKPAQGEPPESITFDSLELWLGPERHRYTLGSEENYPRENAMTVTNNGSPLVYGRAANTTATDPDHSGRVWGSHHVFTAGVEVDEAPQIPEEDLALPVPWYGVLAPEGVWSGDRRRFAENALRYRDLPLPLKWQQSSDEGHKGSVVVGRIDRIWREGSELRAEGVFDNSAFGYEAVRLIAERMIRGVSVDVDDAEGEMSDGSDGAPEGSLTFSSARVSAATLCAIPAFAEAFVALGFWDDHEPPTEGAEMTVTFEGIDPEVFEMVTGWSKEWLFVSEEPWDGSASRFTNAQWKRSCILHVCDGDEKSCHKLPVREPGGALSRRGVHAAASRLNQVDAPPDKVAAAKRALASAYRQLGEEPPFADLVEEFTDGEFVPAKTRDGPGWITHPRPTKEITQYWVTGPGRAKIGWGAPGDFNRCRSQLAKYVQNPDWLAGLCANLHYRALRVWPGQHRGDASLTAAGGPPPRDWFTDPHLDGPTPMHVTEDGRIYGHLALWKTCHTSRGGCVKPPRSPSNYAYFLTGEVLTNDGTVPVGQVTLGGGHASLSLGVQAAVEHYDSTSTAVADIAVGEDHFGIWFAGALRPNVGTDEVAALRAAALSGDWRQVDGAAELIAALAVNVPGFPVPRISMATAGRGTYALTAAGVATEEAAADLLIEMAEGARRTLKVAEARRVLERK